MRILFDQGAPRGLGTVLREHDITEARKLKWERMSNGELLKLAQTAGFDLLLTTDKNLRYHQKPGKPKIAIVVPGQSAWWLVEKHIQAIVATVGSVSAGSYAEVEIPFDK